MDSFFEDVPIPNEAPDVAAKQVSPGPLDPEPEDGEKDAAKDSLAMGKGKPGAGKTPGLWNYTPIECVAVVWASLAASELGETDLNGLHKRVRDFYLPKAKELQRIGAWTDDVARASGNRVISGLENHNAIMKEMLAGINKAAELEAQRVEAAAKREEAASKREDGKQKTLLLKTLLSALPAGTDEWKDVMSQLWELTKI